MERLPKFYKGEDIHITLGAFKDSALEQPGSFEGYGVDVILYTSNESYLIALSSEAADDSEQWLALASLDGTLDAVLPKSLTNDLESGVVRLEIRLTNQATRQSFIASKAAFMLIESRISTIAPCMPE